MRYDDLYKQIGRRLILCALLACAFVACSNPAPGPDAADLERRVQAWWFARQAGDVAGMYAMFEPSFRATKSLTEFRDDANRLRRIAIENVRVVAVSPVPNSNRAIVALVAQTRLPRTGQLVEVDIRDQWTLEGGQWWRVYEAPRTPFE